MTTRDKPFPEPQTARPRSKKDHDARPVVESVPQDARSDRDLAEPRVLTGQNGESPGGMTTEALC